MTRNLFGILGVEALTAAQGTELRAPLQTSPELRKALATIRKHVATLQDDRYLAGDLAAATELVASGELAAAVSTGILPDLTTQ
jgi:histidine ammonia-lyase